MAEPIDLVQQALNALADAGLGNDSPAEAFVIGYQAGWQEALDLCIRIETAINNETGGQMSIIGSEIEAQKQRDPSYIDSGLQWAWGQGYKAGASREITEEEIAAAMDETRKFITLPGAWLENIIRIAFDAARRKAMEG